MVESKQHPLLNWIRTNHKTQAGVARDARISRQLLNDIIWGRAYPSGASARRLVECTGGAVTLDELFDGCDGRTQPSD